MSTTEAGTAAITREKGANPTFGPVRFAAPQSNELRVRIHASAVCHTDVTGIDSGRVLPAIFGHEGAGIVEAVGDAVTAFAVGDRVVLSFDSCGECRSCHDGHPAYCARFGALNSGTRTDVVSVENTLEPVATGWMGQSSWASHVVVHARCATRLSDDIPFALAAPLGCGILTGAGTVFNVLTPGPHDTLLVIGAGAVGLSAVLAARARGCTQITVIEPDPNRRELAHELGASCVLVPGDAVPSRADRILDTVGRQDSLDTALAALSVRGVCATVALRPGRNVVNIAQSEILWGRTLTGVIEGDAVPTRDIPLIVALWRAGRFPLEKLIRTYPFNDIDRAIADTRSGNTIKAVLVTEDEALTSATETIAETDMIEQLRSRALSDDELAALWRNLPTVDPSEIRGLWHGWAAVSDHPVEAALTASNWYGKRFHSSDTVDPIVCRAEDGSLVVDTSFSRGGASLWNIERDGIVTAAMVYDGVPIVDSFTRLSDNALLGVMGGRAVRHQERDFYFVLERSSEE